MTHEEALAGVYPSSADGAARLAWNLEREQVLYKIMPSPEREVAISLTRERVKLLRELVAA